MKKLSFLGIVLILIIASKSFAVLSKVGMSGAQFLKVGIGCRAVGMGGAYTALVNDASSLYWNPAGMALMERPELIICDVNWIADIRNDFVGYVVPLGLSGSFGAAITVLSMGEMEETTIYEPEGTGNMFGASDLAVTLSYARNFTDKFSFGMNVKYIQETIWNMSSQGICFDFGTLYKPGFKSLVWGMAIRNFGIDMSFHGEQLRMSLKDTSWTATDAPQDFEKVTSHYPFPLNFVIGVAYNLIEDRQNILTMALDFSHPNDGSEKLHLGAEYGWDNRFFLRAGCQYDPDVWEDMKTTELTQEELNEEKEPFLKKIYYGSKMSFGMGVRYPIGGQIISIDYAGQDLKRLGLTQRLSIGFIF